MPRNTRTTAPARTPLTDAVDAVDEHLSAYGHQMTWHPAGGSARSQGTCGRCHGRVIVYMAPGGRPAAMADPHMTTVPSDGDGAQDYAECAGRGR